MTVRSLCTFIKTSDMDTRSSHLVKIRPVLQKAKVNADTSNGEYFQNVTLRPIIKFQNLLLIVFSLTWSLMLRLPLDSCREATPSLWKFQKSSRKSCRH